MGRRVDLLVGAENKLNRVERRMRVVFSFGERRRSWV